MDGSLKNRQEIIDELFTLLNIPQFHRIIFHKIEELKLYFKDEIDRYIELKGQFQRSAYGELKIVNEPITKPNQIYHFELNQNNQGNWLVSSIEPSPPPGYENDDIIPMEMIDYIINSHCITGEKIHKKKIKLPSIPNKLFDCSFVKYSDWHFLGNITYINLNSAKNIENKSKKRTTDIYKFNTKDSDEENFKELIHYMKKYPSLKHYFFTELNMKIKPLILDESIDLTSNSQPMDLL